MIIFDLIFSFSIKENQTCYATFNLHNLSDLTNTSTWEVTRILTHPKWSMDKHDLALLFFDKPHSDMAADATPICLSTELKSGATDFVSGWGTRSTEGIEFQLFYHYVS